MCYLIIVVCNLMLTGTKFFTHGGDVSHLTRVGLHVPVIYGEVVRGFMLLKWLPSKGGLKAKVDGFSMSSSAGGVY